MRLIFDLDGTLVDSHPGIQYALQQAVKKLYPWLNVNTLKFKVGPPIRSMFEGVFPKVTATELDQLVVAFREVYDKNAWKMTNLYQNVRETLAIFYTKGIPCYIVTNKPEMATSRILAHLEIAQFFVSVISPDSRQIAFQNKEQMIRHLLTQHNISPSVAVYIGDSADDLLAAESCGLEFIGVEYGYGSLPEEKNFLRVKSFTELLSVIQV